jgi:hypothetical protein
VGPEPQHARALKRSISRRIPTEGVLAVFWNLTLTPNDAAYFTQMAGIAATLLGISFLALTFSLGGLTQRYQTLALPMFLDEERKNGRHQRDGDEASLLVQGKNQRTAHDITDLQVFDGDPLVVFIAFSVSVSWNLFLFALIVSLTLLGGGFNEPWLIAVELLAFSGIITYSMVTRHQKYRILSTYRTSEEKLWVPGQWVVVTVWIAETTLAVWVALSVQCGAVNTSFLCSIEAPRSWAVHLESWYLFTLKAICLVAFTLALYVTNKDLFVFFKSRSSEEMRQRWLTDFVRVYPALERRVDETFRLLGVSKSAAGNIAKQADKSAGHEGVRLLEKVWNKGRPPDEYIREVSETFGRRAGSEGEGMRWRSLLAGDSAVASWMFDVPGIGAWVHDVELCMERILSSHTIDSPDAQ